MMQHPVGSKDKPDFVGDTFGDRQKRDGAHLSDRPDIGRAEIRLTPGTAEALRRFMDNPEA